jgi:hypothetical protein
MPTSRRRPPLPRPTRQGAAAPIEVGLGERERLLDAPPRTPQMTINSRSRRPWAPSPAARMTAMISSTVCGSAG